MIKLSGAVKQHAQLLLPEYPHHMEPPGMQWVSEHSLHLCVLSVGRHDRRLRSADPGLQSEQPLRKQWGCRVYGHQNTVNAG